MLLLVSSVPAQSVITYTYDNVKVGDTMSYKVTKIVSSTNSLNGTLPLQNNTYYHYAITEGMVFTEKVIAKNISQGFEQVQTILLVNLPNNTQLQSQNVNQEYGPEMVGSNNGPSVIDGIPMFLYPVFTNRSDLSLFAPGFLTCFHIGCPIESVKGSTAGSYYIINVKFGTNLNNPTVAIDYSVNWKTGWVEFIDYKFFNSEIRLEEVTNDLINSISSFIITIAPVSMLVLMIGGIFTVCLSYTVYLVRKKPNDTFSKYIHTRLVKSRPQKRSHTHSIDKSLEIIDEIMDEST